MWQKQDKIYSLLEECMQYLMCMPIREKIKKIRSTPNK